MRAKKKKISAGKKCDLDRILSHSTRRSTSIRILPRAATSTLTSKDRGGEGLLVLFFENYKELVRKKCF